MKTLVVALLLMSQTVLAVPYDLELKKPKSLELDKNKMEIVAKIDLACGKYNDEWIDTFVIGMDDSGDRVIGVALLIAESNCDGAKTTKEFEFRYDLTRIGFQDAHDLEHVSVEAMEIKEKK